jgi:hypothetical protein
MERVSEVPVCYNNYNCDRSRARSRVLTRTGKLLQALWILINSTRSSKSSG